jgi:hypothetical protein
MTLLPEQNEHVLDQGEFTGILCARLRNFGWFLGAGASASAGLPAATDILWDLKRQHYCRQENLEINRQDMQSEPVRSRIQAYVESKGFPALWADDESSACFERLFGDDRAPRWPSTPHFADKSSVCLYHAAGASTYGLRRRTPSAPRPRSD